MSNAANGMGARQGAGGGQLGQSGATAMSAEPWGVRAWEGLGEASGREQAWAAIWVPAIAWCEAGWQTQG